MIELNKSVMDHSIESTKNCFGDIPNDLNSTRVWQVYPDKRELAKKEEENPGKLSGGLQKILSEGLIE